MSSAADIGQYSTLEIMVGSTFTPIVGLLTLNLPEMTRTEIETTTLDSDDKEFKPGMRNNGTVSLTQEWSDSRYAEWVARDDGNLDTYKGRATASGTGKVFSAYVAKLSLPIEMDGKLVIAVDLKVSGTVTDEDA